MLAATRVSNAYVDADDDLPSADGAHAVRHANFL